MVAEAPQEALVLILDAVPANVPVARKAVTAYAERCNGDGEKVGLATSEAVTNVVIHAYDEQPGPLRVTAQLCDTDLVVHVCDKGHGLRPDPDSPGMGMGLALIGSMAASTSFADTHPGLDLTMRFPCPSPE
jgi:anti-sigma regulatory factor (Ser/Thr protein kinase)